MVLGYGGFFGVTNQNIYTPSIILTEVNPIFVVLLVLRSSYTTMPESSIEVLNSMSPLRRLRYDDKRVEPRRISRFRVSELCSERVQNGLGSLVI